jgi:membrane fusion protein (multidrug efflux system)
MATAFTQSMRALEADRGRWALASLSVLLGGWGAWFVLARVALYEVIQTARLEVDQAVHPIATPVAGRVVATHLVVGRDVQAGEVLVELDATAFRLQHEEAHQRCSALTAQRQAHQQEIVAEEAARQDERQAARTALAEARARQHEAEVAFQAAAAQAAVFDRL